MEPTLNRIANTTSLHKALPLPTLALASVIAKDGQAVYASSDTFFKGAIFGRDSLEVADDLMDLKPALVHNILLTLGRLQGLEDRVPNEEQPGKIIHEYRTTKLNGKPIDRTSMDLYRKLAHKWGGNEHELAYYGSIDATPHFLRTLGSYCKRYGDNILQEEVTQRDGRTVYMKAVAGKATEWLLRELDRSGSGMLEYQMAHPLGTLNQVWKDSEESYVHENGEMANHDRPISSIEVQGLAYDGLMSAMRMFATEADSYRRRAERLRDTTIEALWQPERTYFALGTDYSPEMGTLRIIKTPTANPAALLDTGFFETLPEDKKQLFITAIVRRITAKDFLTSAGIRSRSLDMAHIVPFWDYHGSYVTWPKETYDIAKGLKRQGFPQLGRQLENRLLNLALKTREYQEFVYVDGWGRVLTGAPRSKKSSKDKVIPVEGHDKPERVQAWTVSALMAIVAGRSQSKFRRRRSDNRHGWQIELETTIMEQIPHVDVHLNPLKLWLQYPTHKYHLTRSKDTRSS